MANWITRTRPSKLPKFHQIEKFTGEGRSTSTPLTILIKGFSWRKRVLIINLQIGLKKSVYFRVKKDIV